MVFVVYEEIRTVVQALTVIFLLLIALPIIHIFRLHGTNGAIIIFLYQYCLLKIFQILDVPKQQSNEPQNDRCPNGGTTFIKYIGRVRCEEMRAARILH
jgi:hypothetical protein